MVLTRQYRVFFAIPFDAPIYSMYQEIIEDLRRDLNVDFEFQIGVRSIVTPSPEFADIENFKVQNQDFLTRFAEVIEISDVVIADLTTNNPSVHLELGIALSLNKNIMRTLGRELGHMATDLNGYEALRYTSKQDLEAKIRGYLAFFLTIKRRGLDQVISTKQELGPRDPHAVMNNEYYYYTQPIRDEKLRDGEIWISFMFDKTVTDEDWFAVLLRASMANPWQGGGYFVFVRKNGELAIRKMGTIEKLGRDKKYLPLDLRVEHTLRVNIDGNHVFASLDENLAQGEHRDNLRYQSPGYVILASYESQVSFSDVRFANHDTIAYR